MIALSRLSRARGLFHLSLAIAATWAVHVFIYKLETHSGVDLHWLNTAADLPLAVWCVLRATRPAYDGAVIFAAAAVIVTMQSVLVLAMEFSGVRHFWIDLTINRLFDLLLVLVIGLAAARIGWRSKKAKREQPPGGADAPSMRADPDALPPFWRLVYNALAAIHNAERPEADHVAYSRPDPVKTSRLKRATQGVYGRPDADNRE